MNLPPHPKQAGFDFFWFKPKVFDERGRRLSLAKDKVEPSVRQRIQHGSHNRDALRGEIPRWVRRWLRRTVRLIIGLTVLGGVLGVLLLQFDPMGTAITWCVFAMYIVLGVLMVFLIVLSTVSDNYSGRGFVRLLLSHRVCLHCAYDLYEVPDEPDGCTVCPECGSVWRLRGDEP